MVRGVRSDGAAGLEQFEPAWRSALHYADAVTQGGHAVTDELYGSLAAHWDAGQIVEITLVIGLFAFFNRVTDALRVEVTT
jgi:alkylhydroperoxidase family enzyme